MSELPPHDWHAQIIAQILSAYQRFRPTLYVEVGVDRGLTVQTVAPYVDIGHAVDITFANLARPLPNWFVQHEMSSDLFFQQMDSQADVIFIDANHSERFVAKDVANALAHITDDGTVIVHDTIPLDWSDNMHCGDGYKFIRKLRLAHPALQIWTMPLFPGLTLISHRYMPLGLEV